MIDFEMDGKQVRNPKVLPLSTTFQDPMTSSESITKPLGFIYGKSSSFSAEILTVKEEPGAGHFRDVG